MSNMNDRSSKLRLWKSNVSYPFASEIKAIILLIEVPQLQSGHAEYMFTVYLLICLLFSIIELIFIAYYISCETNTLSARECGCNCLQYIL